MHSSSTALLIRRVRAPKVSRPHGYEQATIHMVGLVAIVASSVILLGAFLLGVLLFAKPSLNFSFMMVLLSTSAVLVLFWGVLLNLRIVRTGVRVLDRGPLQFVPRGYVGPLSIMVGLCMLAAGLIVVLSWFGIGGEEITGPVGKYGGGIAVLLGGMAYLAYLGVKACTSPGIKAEAEGVTWWAGVTEHSLQWDDVSAVTAQVQGRNKSLHITEVDGREHKLMPLYFGSDPYLVAEIIQHYLEVPADRPELADPISAIERVAEIEVMHPGQVT